MSAAVAEAVAAATRKPIAAIMRSSCKTPSCLFQDEKQSRCGPDCATVAFDLAKRARPQPGRRSASDVRGCRFPRAARSMALRPPRDSWMTDQPLADTCGLARACAHARRGDHFEGTKSGLPLASLIWAAQSR